MLFKDITILDEDLQVREHMYVGTKGDRITYIGTGAPCDAQRAAGDVDMDRVVDGRGKLLMSGFYNAHAHSPMTLLRGYGENLPLSRWLNERIFPFEDKLTGPAVYAGTLLAMAESLRYGIVSTTDMYYFPDEMAAAISDSGAKNNFSRSVTCFDDSDLMDLPAGKEMVHAFETYHGAADGRIKVDMSLHAEYTNPEKIVRQLAELTGSLGANMHVHISETKAEHEECKGRHDGRTPVRFLDDCGLFATPTTAAHCVWIEGEDYDILKERGVTVAVNPISNLKLASGVCNVQALLDKGINVAIGTDSVSSNNSLNYIEEMKVFAIASKMMYNAPEAVSPIDTLRAATIGGAKSQGRADCGVLKEGYKADLVMIDIDTPWMYPVHNLATNLVYSASGSDVVMTMVDGRVLYEDGEYATIDIEKAKADVTSETEKILAQL